MPLRRAALVAPALLGRGVVVKREDAALHRAARSLAGAQLVDLSLVLLPSLQADRANIRNHGEGTGEGCGQ